MLPNANIETDHAAQLSRAERWLNRDPLRCEKIARAVLVLQPHSEKAIKLLGRSLRAQNKPNEAVENLRDYLEHDPGLAPCRLELALALRDLGNAPASIDELCKTASLDPNIEYIWLMLGNLHFESGDRASADECFGKHVSHAAGYKHIRGASAALKTGAVHDAMSILRNHLQSLPDDIAAMGLLGEACARAGYHDEAERLLRLCIERHPSFYAARLNLGAVLVRVDNATEALIHADFLLKTMPRDQAGRRLRASALARLDRFDEATRVYEELLGDFPQDHITLVEYGHALRGAGSASAAAAAYRRAAKAKLDYGDAYWGLANLKTERFTPEEVEIITSLVAREDTDATNAVRLHFALGKALEDNHEYAQSFEHYKKGNALRKAMVRYSPGDIERRVRFAKECFTQQFFAARDGWGSMLPDPIFIVGVARSGSTLVEQMLASHPMVEGTRELSDLKRVSDQFAQQLRSRDMYSYDAFSCLDASGAAELGTNYLSKTRNYRRSGKPYFTDKMPTNFFRIGLIQLILPNAKIIDVRRSPMGCCFSNFKQFYAEGHSYSYDFQDMAHYYGNYLELMEHFDGVLPGRIHRVVHEQLVSDPDTEIRRLLEYCGLGFDPACLRFYDNTRPVRTVSSEQVRNPISSAAVEHWRNYEPWLTPLKDALRRTERAELASL